MKKEIVTIRVNGFIAVSSEKSVDENGNFQLKGDVYALPSMIQATTWNWPLDMTTGRLARNEANEPCVTVKEPWSKDCGIEIARAVQTAYQTGTGVMSRYFLDDDIDYDDWDDDEDDEVDYTNNLDRLCRGDESVFVKIGETAGHARQWAGWIKNNPGEVYELEDLTKIPGIAKTTAARIKREWVEHGFSEYRGWEDVCDAWKTC